MKSFATLFISPLPPLPLSLPSSSPFSSLPTVSFFPFCELFFKKITLLRSTHKKKKKTTLPDRASHRNTHVFPDSTCQWTSVHLEWPFWSRGFGLPLPVTSSCTCPPQGRSGRVITTKAHLLPLPGLICHLGCTLLHHLLVTFLCLFCKCSPTRTHSCFQRNMYITGKDLHMGKNMSHFLFPGLYHLPERYIFFDQLC